MKGERILITGGAGFLGSHFVRHILNLEADRVISVDKLTYAGDPARLDDVSSETRYLLVEADIAEPEAIKEIFMSHRPHVVAHFAAESHVTRSEFVPDLFYRTNVEGTRVLLEAAIEVGVRRFVHVSTDEVYGPIVSGYFKEEDKPPGDGQASSTYAKSKSLSDDLVRSYSDRLDVIVVRPTNAFGPHQFPEKAFARWVTRALRGEQILVWGDGLYIRQWLYAEDFAQAIWLIALKGVSGEVYNVGPHHEPEITNLRLARWLAGHLDLPEDNVQLTEYDRPAHDRRYAVDSSKVRALGWKPGDVWEQFAKTVEWYRANSGWWERHVMVAESIYKDVRT